MDHHPGAALNSIQGRVVRRKSGVGVADLVVVAFVVTDASRDEGHDCDGREQGQRIGSSLTDHLGNFNITYTDDEIASAAHRRPDLQVAVFASDDDGGIEQLATGGAVRQGCGRKESWFIRLPEGAGTVANATPGLGEAVEQLHALAKRYSEASERAFAAHGDEGGAAGPAFSQRYREARMRQVAASQASSPPGRAPGTFLATHTVIIDMGRGEGEVVYDKKAHRLTYQPAAGGAALALRFVGVRYRRAGEAPGVIGTALIIDSARGAAHLSIPWSASLVTTFEATPGALYAEHAGRRRRAAAAKRQAAYDDREPI